jgi:AMMECR1 domain-containing protein
VVDPQLGDALLVRARNAIASESGGAQVKEPEHPALHEPGATFVTLTRQGELRGCIGSFQAYRPLDQDVRENARAAAFRDRRFAPLCVAGAPGRSREGEIGA